MTFFQQNIEMRKRNNSIAVVGVLHPGVTGFLDAYLRSLEKQTNQCFDLVLANDGVAAANQMLSSTELSITIIPIIGSPPMIRAELFRRTMELGYEKIIFTDCDDTFSSNRVEVMGSLLNEFPLIVNDLDIVASDEENSMLGYFGQRINENHLIDANYVRHKNMLGLSNTAVRSDAFATIAEDLSTNVPV